MSKMKPSRKPPLARSSIRVRPLLSTTATSVQTPPGSLTKSQKRNPGPDLEESDLRPEYRTISHELRALERMVSDELGKEETATNTGARKSFRIGSSSLFERGKFYDVYSERRNERLKRKIGMLNEEESGLKTPFNLGVNAESSKKRDAKKRGNLKKSVATAYTVESSGIPRYALRSLSKENKKPPLPLPLPAAAAYYERSALPSERKVGSRRARKL